MNRIVHVLDLETLGTKPGCIVLSIGAVRVDLTANRVLSEFYAAINPLDSVRYGLTICAETLLWWQEQSEAARKAAFMGTGTLKGAGSEFAEWLAAAPLAPIYGNSPAFDCSLLEAAFEATGGRAPWKYFDERCLRTELDFYRRIGVDVDRCRESAMTEAVFRVGEWMKHHALHDAILEAELLLACERARKGQNDVG